LFSGRRENGERELHETESKFFTWPNDVDRALQWALEQDAAEREVYACAHLLTKRRRKKENAARLWCLYVDGDGAQVPPNIPQPTAVVQSSPGREQFYWRLTEAIDPASGEALNKRLAYAMGADRSGWDLTQLLRVPGTLNRKYASAPLVDLVTVVGGQPHV